MAVLSYKTITLSSASEYFILVAETKEMHDIQTNMHRFQFFLPDINKVVPAAFLKEERFPQAARHIIRGRHSF